MHVRRAALGQRLDFEGAGGKGRMNLMRRLAGIAAIYVVILTVASAVSARALGPNWIRTTSLSR